MLQLWHNPRLRLAVNAAKSQSMPKDNIQRAINKSQAGDGDNYEELRYEGETAGEAARCACCFSAVGHFCACHRLFQVAPGTDVVRKSEAQMQVLVQAAPALSTEVLP